MNRPRTPPRKAAETGSHGRAALCCAILAAATVIVFSGLRSHEFVGLDDDEYVTGNPMVRAGWTASGVRWAFTTFANSNWHPLTWLSHMADCQFYGLRAGAHLTTNLVLHILSSILLLLALLRMTGRLAPSAVVAAMFAIHPLHVESVAWVAERKDVLSGVFWMLTLLFYSWYARAENKRIPYLAVLGSFAAGLLAKPMLVTLPFVLLLLDYWPLNRFGAAAVREKIPLFLLSAASSVVTYIAQSHGGAVQPLTAYPFSVRVSNALVSYALYIWKTVWPANLAVFYPFQPPSAAAAALAVLVLSALTTCAVIYRKKYPYLFTGWFWYVGTLVPVIGIIQVGEQAMADRYTYLPLIGLFVAVVWSVFIYVDARPKLAHLGAGLALAGLVLLGWASRKQVALWQNSVVLFEHALSVTSNNFMIENNLGLVFYRAGRAADARPHLEKAVQLVPHHADARENLGLVYAALGRPDLAAAQYRESLRGNPESSSAHYNLGVLMAGEGRLPEALSEFEEAVRLQPAYADAHNAAGFISLQLGRKDDARRYLDEAVRLKPESPEAHNNMGLLLASLGRYDEAMREYSLALDLNPDFAAAQNNLRRLQEIVSSPNR